MKLLELEERFAGLSSEGSAHEDQEFGLMACEEALTAARAGNYGVGAILVGPNGDILEQG